MGINCYGFITVKDGIKAETLNAEMLKLFGEDVFYLRYQVRNTVDIDFDGVRYYGIGYGRGPALKIITTLEFLRRHPSVTEVYYGPDNVDEVIQCWTKRDTDSLLDYYFEKGYGR